MQIINAELKDRLAAVEAERDAALAECEEQARLLGMGGERELRLITERDAAMARAEKAEKRVEVLEKVAAIAAECVAHCESPICAEESLKQALADAGVGVGE